MQRFLLTWAPWGRKDLFFCRPFPNSKRAAAKNKKLRGIFLCAVKAGEAILFSPPPFWSEEVDSRRRQKRMRSIFFCAFSTKYGKSVIFLSVFNNFCEKCCETIVLLVFRIGRQRIGRQWIGRQRATDFGAGDPLTRQKKHI